MKIAQKKEQLVPPPSRWVYQRLGKIAIVNGRGNHAKPTLTSD